MPVSIAGRALAPPDRRSKPGKSTGGTGREGRETRTGTPVSRLPGPLVTPVADTAPASPVVLSATQAQARQKGQLSRVTGVGGRRQTGSRLGGRTALTGALGLGGAALTTKTLLGQ